VLSRSALLLSSRARSGLTPSRDLLLIALLFSAAASAATSTVWELNGYQDFLRGKIAGLSLTADGRLTNGPALAPVYDTDQSEIWAVATAPDGSIYLGTGHRGRLIKVDASGKGSVIWTANEPEIFALAVDRAGVVYAGTSPEGKVYRIENGKATEYFAPGQPYIWSLALAPDGALYVGTGQQGKIYRVTAGAGNTGHGELYYETGQSHVTALAFDREGRLLAGSEPNGILYRITSNAGGGNTRAKGFVLYQSHLPEIRSIITAPDGVIYASALGGSVAQRVNAATSTTVSSTPMVTAPPTSITVTADAQAALATPPKPDASKAATTPPTVASAASLTESTGVEKSAVYRIAPDNTVDTLWTSKDENAYDFAPEASGTLLVLTDAQGRIYRVDPRAGHGADAALVVQANESDATRLISSARGTFAAIGSASRLVRLDPSSKTAGSFESPVHDCGAVARWGRISWISSAQGLVASNSSAQGVIPSNSSAQGIIFRTRTGNSQRPDSTWSDWSAPITAPSVIASPNARFVQWRAEFPNTPAEPARAELSSVRLAYLPQNSSPTVRSISVTSASSASKVTAAVSSSSAYSVTVTDSGDASTSAGTQAQTLSRPSGQQMIVTWQADDPDGDKLAYTLYFRGEGERDWKLLRANLSDNTYVLDSDSLADGRYYFRVVASDRPSNTADQAREAEFVSTPVLIDSTPPIVTASAPRRLSGTIRVGAATQASDVLEIDVDAEDRGSDLRRCEYSLDTQPWLPVEAADGVTDSPREHFLIRIDNFPAGEHVVVIRVYDAAGNAGLAKVIVR
jgi:hypothetical protein